MKHPAFTEDELDILVDAVIEYSHFLKENAKPESDRLAKTMALKERLKERKFNGL